MYCAEDTTVQTGGNSGNAGKMSPRNLLVTTICDQLKLATDGRAKVIGVALKDRGAILPAGHAANGAFWFDSKDGNWISSTFYMKELPKWAQEYNAKRLPDQYLSQKWEASLAMDQYLESTPDDEPYESLMPGEQKSIFPHEFTTISGGSKYEGLRTSPFGDALTKEFALAALKGEQMGQDAITDFLCVSFSSPDYIGHSFGTHAVETEDNYLRLDKQLADLFAQLDATVGKGEWVSFLSADHGVADIPGFLKSYHIPADVKPYGEVGDAAKAALQQAYGPGQWVLAYVNQQIYLNQALFLEKKIDLEEACSVVKRALLKQKGVLNVVNLNNPANQLIPSLHLEMIRNVYQPNRSGDLYVIFNAGWFEGRSRGTTHGTMYAYDTHVPLLFYGWGIKPGQTLRRTAIADIAPTVAALLGILEPSGTIGAPIEEVLK
jgi:predicted AlkP superfamily pyrophosphatase or phosphodiesterase